MLFTVMLIFLPALLTNCGHGECLSYIGTEGALRMAAVRKLQIVDEALLLDATAEALL